MSPWLMLAAALHAPARADVIDRIIAVVEDELVLESDVRIEAGLAAVDPGGSPLWERQPDPLQRVIEAAMFRALAGDVSLYQPSDDAVAGRVQGMRDRAGSTEAWQQLLSGLGLDAPSLAAATRRRMVAEAYAARTIQVDPKNLPAWVAACDVLVDQVRARIRVRLIPAPEAD